MNIFAISLERSKERNSYIKRHLSNRTKLPWETLGVDGHELHRNSSEWPHAPRHRDAIVGCALSHIQAYRKIVERGLPWGVVIEDDVALPKNIDEIIAAVGKEIRSDEVIHLHNRTTKPSKFSSRNAKHVLGHKLVYPIDANDMRTGAAYVIGQDAAQRIAEFNDPVQVLSDSWNTMYQNDVIGGFRMAYPNVVRMVPFGSVIKPELNHTKVQHLALNLMNNAIVRGLRRMRRAYLTRSHERNISIVDEPSPFIR